MKVEAAVKTHFAAIAILEVEARSQNGMSYTCRFQPYLTFARRTTIVRPTVKICVLSDHRITTSIDSRGYYHSQNDEDIVSSKLTLYDKTRV